MKARQLYTFLSKASTIKLKGCCYFDIVRVCMRKGTGKLMRQILLQFVIIMCGYYVVSIIWNIVGHNAVLLSVQDLQKGVFIGIVYSLTRIIINKLE